MWARKTRGESSEGFLQSCVGWAVATVYMCVCVRVCVCVCTCVCVRGACIYLLVLVCLTPLCRGLVPLHNACSYGHLQVTELLIQVSSPCVLL